MSSAAAAIGARILKFSPKKMRNGVLTSNADLRAKFGRCLRKISLRYAIFPPPPPHSNPRRNERNSYFDYRITSAQFAAAIWFIYLLFPFSRKKGPFYRVGQLRFLACKKKKKTGPALRQLSFGTAELKNGRYTGKMGARRSLVDMRDTFLQS